MVTCIGTIKQVEQLVPDGEPFKEELRKFREGIFLELPENNRHLWVGASQIFVKHFSADQSEWLPWQKDAAKIFLDAQRELMADRMG